jgi:hypothetical protein
MADARPPHYLALMLPPMAPDQYGLLREDVRQHGVRHPIVLYEGQVLDGVHRQRAAIETGREPHYVEHTDGDPLAFVLSENLARRHMNATERTKVAAAVYELLPDRRIYRPEATSSDELVARGKDGRRNIEVARQFGISATSLVRALAVKAAAPERFREMDGQTLTISRAYAELPRNGRLRSRPTPTAAEKRAAQHAKDEKVWRRVTAANGAIQKVLAEQDAILAAIENKRDVEAVAALAQSVHRSIAILERVADAARGRLSPAQIERMWALLREGGYA